MSYEYLSFLSALFASFHDLCQQLLQDRELFHNFAIATQALLVERRLAWLIRIKKAGRRMLVLRPAFG